MFKLQKATDKFDITQLKSKEKSLQRKSLVL